VELVEEGSDAEGRLPETRTDLGGRGHGRQFDAVRTGYRLGAGHRVMREGEQGDMAVDGRDREVIRFVPAARELDPFPVPARAPRTRHTPDIAGAEVGQDLIVGGREVIVAMILETVGRGHPHQNSLCSLIQTCSLRLYPKILVLWPNRSPSLSHSLHRHRRLPGMAHTRSLL